MKFEIVKEDKKANVKQKIIKGAKTTAKLLLIGAGAALVGILTVGLASAASGSSETDDEEEKTEEE